MRVIRVQTAPFATADADVLTADRTDVGAMAVFTGRVRDFNEGAGVETLFLDHYPGMTEAALDAIAATAEARWPLLGTLIIHRHGELHPGDPIVLVAATSAHRDAAFEACRYMMDALKTEAPFWKREEGPDGARWVDARDSDTAARAKWD